MKPSKDLKTIYIIAIISSIILILGCGVCTTPDSPTYISAWDNISNGEIDILRTPIYPIFLGIMKIIFGNNYYCFVVICLQHILFLLSIKYFYGFMTKMISSSSLVFWLTLIYILPFTITWNNFILTESFAISGTNFILYFTHRIYHQYRVRTSSILFCIILSLLVLLRPALIYMLPVYLFGYSIILRKKKKSAFAGISGVLVASLCLFVYMKMFESKYGIFASSNVSTINQIGIAQKYNLFYPDVIENQNLKKDIIAGVDGETILKRHDLATINNALSSSYKKQPLQVLGSCYARLYRSKNNNFFVTYIPKWGIVLDWFCLYLNILYLFIIVYTIIMLVWIVNKKTIPWFSLLLYMLCISNIIVAIYGAPMEWERLILPSLPMIVVMFGQLCSLFKIVPLYQIEYY